MDEIERLKAELEQQQDWNIDLRDENEQVIARNRELRAEIELVKEKRHALELLAESYRAIIGKLLIYGRERPDAYDTYYEAEAEARAALNGNEK